MLVLSRRAEQRIIITVGNEVITITAIEIRSNNDGKSVKLGFEASNNVTIDREEIYKDKYMCKEILTKKNKHPIVKFNNEK